LFGSMSARIAGVGDQPLDRPALNLICWPRFLARARARPRLAVREIAS
jgi:hypothetical protein